MRLAVCSLSIGDEYKQTVKYCILSLRKYCEKHNYPLITDESYKIQDRDYMWSKIPLLRRTLPDYDYIVWIDADMMIMNDEIKLEDFIDLYLGNRQMMLATDCGNQINTGFWILRNSQYTRDILDIIQNTPEIAGNFHEQGVFTELHRKKNLFNLEQHTRIIPECKQRIFNATIYNFVYGDFLIHFLGIKKWENLTILDRDHYPYEKIDEESQESFQYRLSWIKENYKDVRNPRYIKCEPQATVEVCTFFTGEKYSPEVIHYGYKSMQTYCNKYKYLFYPQTDSLIPDLPPHWTKFALMLKILKKSETDYLVWFDADIMIMNHDISIHDVISNHMDGYDLLACRDVSEEINTGVLIVRNTEYVRKILELMLNLPELRYRGCEDQDTFNRIYQRNVLGFQNKCKILPSCQQRELNPCVGLYKWDTWLIHFFSLSKEGLQKSFNDFYPYKKDGEFEEVYQHRLNWLKNF